MLKDVEAAGSIVSIGVEFRSSTLEDAQVVVVSGLDLAVRRLDGCV